MFLTLKCCVLKNTSSKLSIINQKHFLILKTPKTLFAKGHGRLPNKTSHLLVKQAKKKYQTHHIQLLCNRNERHHPTEHSITPNPTMQNNGDVNNYDNYIQ